jgi:hypothetical protein
LRGVEESGIRKYCVCRRQVVPACRRGTTQPACLSWMAMLWVQGSGNRSSEMWRGLGESDVGFCCR